MYYYSVIIPTFNEENSILSVIAEIQSLDLDAEIIVVDDGSTDGTKEIIEKRFSDCNSSVRLISNTSKSGNGSSIKTGIIAATGQYVIMIDADGQYQPSDIPNLIKLSNSNKMVVGARKRPESSTKIQRDLPNIIYNYIASWMVGNKVLDLTSGLRLVDAKLAKAIAHILPDGFSYPTTITMIIFALEYPVTYVPIITLEREFGQSRLRYWKDGILGISMKIIRFSLLFFPIKFFLPLIIIFLLYEASFFVSHPSLLVEGGINHFLLLILATFMISMLYQNSCRYKYDLKKEYMKLLNQ